MAVFIVETPLQEKRPYLLKKDRTLNKFPRHIGKEGKRRSFWKRFRKVA